MLLDCLSKEDFVQVVNKILCTDYEEYNIDWRIKMLKLSKKAKLWIVYIKACATRDKMAAAYREACTAYDKTDAACRKARKLYYGRVE